MCRLQINGSELVERNKSSGNGIVTLEASVQNGSIVCKAELILAPSSAALEWNKSTTPASSASSPAHDDGGDIFALAAGAVQRLFPLPNVLFSCLRFLGYLPN